MKIYLASRYSRHKELQEIACVLMSQGHEITSRWIWGNHRIDDEGLSIEAKRAERERFAQEDFDDLKHAKVVISFTEIPRSTNSRGGRHVEFGIALASKKRCVVVGPRENVFHCLPGVEVVDKINEVTWLFSGITPVQKKVKGE
uniref:Putative nucleoside deoxyribosyltransferase n=2 Tax=viral metagenome TaxID=1070528 RepID=A0A6M3IQQ6_9ZZZZ